MQITSNQEAAKPNQGAASAPIANGRLYRMAVNLARSGRYAEASATLQAALAAGDCAAIDALDLQARIYAQQGRYLDAESCWLKAKNLNGANPAYDQALSRLRRSRLPIHWILQMSAALAAVLLMGFFLWQITVVNPAHSAGLRANAAMADSILVEIAALKNDAREEGRGLTAKVANLGSKLDGLQTQVVQTGELASTSGLKLENGLDAAQSAIARRLDAIEMSLRNELKSAAKSAELESLVGTIAKIQKRIEEMEAVVRLNMKSMATSGDIAALGRTVIALQKQLGQVEVAIQKLKMEPAKSLQHADPQSPALLPGTQPVERNQ